ncbi:sensor histidine kinase [Promicromonospora kroppenstedtii]|uniref:Sensor histidine kinase n=1 Tax=Promicromonospora kroppenstedtii TaxID=440482 RepID=A0ABW7XNX9_9MICO
MSSRPVDAGPAPTPVDARSALRLTRSVSATWWYMALGVVSFELIAVLLTVVVLVEDERDALTTLAVAVGGLLWWLATLLPVAAYRHRAEDAPLLVPRQHLPSLLVGVVYGLGAGYATGMWVVLALPVLQAVILLNWPPGVRLRVVVAATALLVLLWVVDGNQSLGADSAPSAFQLAFLSTILPITSVSSLWWWDVLVTLDKARASEARLAATQERLRVATDVHDLQGHHLQVIALQLELAERLMPQDPAAGMEQLRAARASVGDARQGTRDLATRFRSVPLRDEIANAVDLLRAAGTVTEATVDPDSPQAPASALGPVIRETTTNVLRHGGGRWARLDLSRSNGSWLYEIANDVADGSDAVAVADPAGASGGAGLEGIARRAAEVGGHLDVRREHGSFTVTVTVPSEGENAG